MKKSKILTLLALTFFTLALSACGTAFNASSWPGITVDEESNTVYVSYNQHLFALEADTGRENWRFPAEADNSVSFYAAAKKSVDGNLLVGAYDNQLYSLDPASQGRAIWQFNSAKNRFIGSPLAVDTGIFAPNSDSMLYALSNDGQLQWTFAAEDAFWSSPVSDGESLYVSSMDHNLYALRAQNGNLIWQQDLGGGIIGEPALGDTGNLFVGTFGSEVISLNSRNGFVQWRTPTDALIWGGPSYSEGLVISADIDGNVYALDANNGRELWRVSAEGAITGSPLIANEHVYVGTESGQILSIGLDGVIQWTRTVIGQVLSSPAIADDLVLFGVVEGEAIVIAVDANGNSVWSYTPQN